MWLVNTTVTTHKEGFLAIFVKKKPLSCPLCRLSVTVAQKESQCNYKRVSVCVLPILDSLDLLLSHTF